jgi:hypothetical protein
MPEQRIPITPEIIKQSKTIRCDCGGILFRGGLVFKKISQFVSPTGKEELFPIEVIVCEKCGLVPSDFNTHKIIPEEIVSKPPKQEAWGSGKVSQSSACGCGDDCCKDERTKDELS